MNNMFMYRRGSKRGSALLVLMIIIMLVAAGGASLVNFAKQQAFSAARIRDYIKAQAYAEAGANEAYSIIKTNWAARSDPSYFPARTFADGSYDATVVAVSSNYAAVTCVGTRAGQTATVKLDIYNANPSTAGTSGSGPPPAVGAYTIAIMSCGKMNWSGSGSIDVGTGKVHGNGVFKMTGSKKVKGNISSSTKIWLTGSTEITGDAAAPVFNASGSAITGTKTIGPVDTVTLPSIDLTPYYNTALANGQVYNGNQHFTGSSDLVPVGGIMWVNGNFKWSGSGRLVGCFIATGSIDISGSGDQIKVDNYPALVSRDADIDISGSGKFHGLLYAKTTFDKSGSGDVVGSIMCGGDFDSSGSWSAMAYENSTPVPPAGGGGGTPGTEGDQIGVSAWQM